MAVKWVIVRLPADLHAELKGLCKKFDKAQLLGRSNVPAEFADRGGTPLHYAIKRCLDHFQGHRRRAKLQGRRRQNKAISDTSPGET